MFRQLFRPIPLAALVVVLSGSAVAAEPMSFPGADWDEAPPASQGVDAFKLAAAMEYLAGNTGRDGTNEALIVRRGRLIWHGPRIDKVHGVWSCTKSFTSTVAGLLIEDGKCTLDTPARDHMPVLAQTYPAVTLRHFTTMTSGYRAVGDEPRGSYIHGPSRTWFQPNASPQFAPPGSKFAYWDSAMNEFGLVLTRIAGEPIADLFRRRVAEPIGMNPKAWRWGDFGNVGGLGVKVNGGSGNSGSHIYLSAREMARFGHLFLNRGRWRGKQLVSAAWVDAATRVHVPADLPHGQPECSIDGRGVYGFNWWVNGTKPDGKRKWPAAPPGTFAASGFNNNQCFVVPEWEMVAVRLGLDGNVSDSVWSEFFARLAMAVKTEGDSS